jgi:transcriptional regulator with XRE-family HTH domain
LPNDAWILRQTSSPEARRQYEIERLAVWAADLVARVMEEQQISKADVAKRLGKSRAFVTQVLSGSRNMTLRTFADLAWACDCRLTVASEPLREGQFVSQPVSLIRTAAPRLVARAPEDTPEERPARERQYLVG